MATNPQPGSGNTLPGVSFPRSSSGPSSYHAVSEKSPDDKVQVLTVQAVRADRAHLYGLWSALELIPLWQEFVVSVTPLAGRRSHWVMGNPEDPKGKRIEFDSEITEDVPGQSIAWTSVSHDVDLSGRVTFEPASEARGTRVTLLQQTKVPGGLFGNAVLGGAVRSPRQIAKENLRHFKQLAESGEIPNVEGQPHGPRGISGAFKRWMYGETNPTPAGTSQQS